MGCTDSNVAQRPTKILPKIQIIQNSDSEHYIFGSLSEQQQLWACIKTDINSLHPVTISKIQPPQLFNSNQSFNFPNFAQMTKIDNSQWYLISGGINFKLDNIFSDVFLYHSASNKMLKICSMLQCRYTHVAVNAKNCVYLIGGRQFGQDHQAILKHCEKISFDFDLSSSFEEIQSKVTSLKWEQISSMNVSRCSQISCIFNNKIYVIGGYTAEFQRSTIIQYLSLQKAQTKWVSLQVQLPFGIQSCFFTSFVQNQIVIFGGNCNSGPLDTVLSLCLLEGRESIKSNHTMKSKKILHKGYCEKQMIFLLGGNSKMDVQIYEYLYTDESQNQNKEKIFYSQLSNYFKTVQQFQSTTHSTSTLSISSSKTEPFLAGSASDQKIFIFGTSEQPFILQLNISAPYAHKHACPLSIKLHALQGGLHIPQLNGCLLIGGITDAQDSVSDSVYLYHEQQGQSRELGKMVDARYAFGVARVKQWVYVIGGGNADGEGGLVILSQCERINVRELLGKEKKGLWECVSSLPFGIMSPMVVNFQDSLYVFGGMKDNKQRNRSVLKQVKNSWQTIKFQLPFGIQASSIYKNNQNSFLIFGGRLANGDSKGIWQLTFIKDGEDCVFQQKAQMKQAKCLHHVYKPQKQDFFVVLGGSQQILSYYDQKTLKTIQSDILAGMKSTFLQSLSSLKDKTLKNYTFIMQ